MGPSRSIWSHLWTTDHSSNHCLATWYIFICSVIWGIMRNIYYFDSSWSKIYPAKKTLMQYLCSVATSRILSRIAHHLGLLSCTWLVHVPDKRCPSVKNPQELTIVLINTLTANIWRALPLAISTWVALGHNLRLNNLHRAWDRQRVRDVYNGV